MQVYSRGLLWALILLLAIPFVPLTQVRHDLPTFLTLSDLLAVEEFDTFREVERPLSSSFDAPLSPAPGASMFLADPPVRRHPTVSHVEPDTRWRDLYLLPRHNSKYKSGRAS